ncbi:hypothetical protein [Candidatus Lokiarchaeum ossiferum]|uniref:hypothetical protein n=1 Tax=Candidatus Lokiarchaeum ossiferum TaxID=2951803 RepID=UPI00352C3129
MSSKKPLIRNIPTYTQHPNGCGLSALLMLLDLPQNKEIEDFLQKTWNKVKLIFLKTKFEQKELQYAIALQYLLLKAVGYSSKEGKDQIYSFFSDRLNYTYEDIRVMNSFNQEQFHKAMLDQGKLKEGYLYLNYTQDRDYITPIMLMENIHTMKTDLELKILAEIFNYEFLYQDSEDMTGAIYFTQKELKKKISQNTKVKWNKLEQFANNPDYIIIYGQYYHWLSIRGIYRTSQLADKERIKQLETQNGSNIEESSTEKSESTKSTLEVIQDIFEDDFFDMKEWNYKKMMIDLNDPALNERVILDFQSLSESDRFYIFKKRANSNFQIFETFLNHLTHDIKHEIALWKDYVENKGKKTSRNIKRSQNETSDDITKDTSAANSDDSEAKILHLEQTINYIDKKERHEQSKIAAAGQIKLSSKKDAPKFKVNSKSKKSNEPPMFWDMMDDD